MRATRVLLHMFPTDANESENPKWLNFHSAYRAGVLLVRSFVLFGVRLDGRGRGGERQK